MIPTAEWLLHGSFQAPKVKAAKKSQAAPSPEVRADEKQAVLNDVLAIMSAPAQPKAAPRSKKPKLDSNPNPAPPQVRLLASLGKVTAFRGPRV